MAVLGLVGLNHGAEGIQNFLDGLMELRLAGVLGNYFVDNLINVRHDVSPFMQRFLVTEAVSVGQTATVLTYPVHYTPFSA
jgi:hypothetical protein